MAPLQPSTSAEVEVTWKAQDTDECGVLGCTRRWSDIIPRERIQVDRREAMFGIPALSGLGLATWTAAPQSVAVCPRHFSILHRADGVELGYRKVNGKIRAYVKAEHF